MSEVCEILKLYVASGHIEDAMLLDYDTGQLNMAYGIRMKKKGRHPAPLFFLSFCPGCGTPQNTDKTKGPVGLFCTLAGVPIRDKE